MDAIIQYYQQYQSQIFSVASNLAIALAVFIVTKWVARLTRKAVRNAMNRFSQQEQTIVNLFSSLSGYAVYLIGLVIILDLFGVNTASLVALVGAAGLAIGLALKDTLSNVAAGVMVLFLKPLKLGEFIELSGTSGTVKEIGLFTTILETGDGIFISMPNSQVWGNTIKNFTRNGKRRMDLTVGISYGDSIDTGLAVLKDLASQEARLLTEPEPQVIVHMLADSSVNLQLRAWATTDQYWPTYWHMQKEIKLKIEQAGLTIPFPQQDVHHHHHNQGTGAESKV